MSTPLRITVAMSGGVDSSVTALLLKQQGHQISGLFMKNWENEEPDSPCTAETDLADAINVADKLTIDIDGENFAAEYREHVFEHFISEHRAGRTPNPDILCNKEIKFKVFLNHALARGADKVATGHYARIDCVDGLYRLLKGLDGNKDQSYFLYTLGQYELSHSLFPIGELDKTLVRELAAEADFDNHNKKDSTGICFIGERDFRPFLKRYISPQPGPIETVDGETLGEHEGLMFYTLGQRQGLGIGGIAESSGEPWYVVDKNTDNNVLLIAQGHNHPRLFHQHLSADTLDWVSGKAPELPLSCHAKIRYRQSDQPCTLRQDSDLGLIVDFDEPQRAVTPGQAIVFYQGDICLGGGTIVSKWNTHD
ncbi:MAG: tRNA 2-thiouridine(34) synthase MnmA [Gammaproteobacteria bacterium]|nr:MAG: tRNA 2-thiouridine(34) synthase MnmA [Gammaproteobacteria bacterium]